MKTTSRPEIVTVDANALSVACPCCTAPTVKLKRGSSLRHCVLCAKVIRVASK